MKRLRIIYVLVISLMLFGFSISCDNGGSYYINALLDDTAYEWKLGFTVLAGDAFGFVRTGSPDTTTLIATPDVETGVSQPENYVEIRFEGNTIGTYATSDIIIALYHINGVDWLFTDITVVVTTFEDVGGVITGTFSGTIDEEETTNTMTVTDGQFRVIRVPDDSDFGD